MQPLNPSCQGDLIPNPLNPPCQGDFPEGGATWFIDDNLD